MYLDYFLSHCKAEKKLSEKTIEAYTSDLKQFKKYIKDHTKDANTPHHHANLEKKDQY